MADIEVNDRYTTMRVSHGTKHASANGYISHWFFERERQFLTAKIGPGLTLDAACGSALMLKDCDDIQVIGLDFNEIACRQAKQNQVEVSRGDVLQLPFKSETFSNIINCQFLNQQTPGARRDFLLETSRVLAPGGRLYILWRGADTLIHRIANFVDNLIRKLLGREIFPQYFHSPSLLIEDAEEQGLRVAELQMTLPFGPQSVSPNSLTARFLGASYYVCLEKVCLEKVCLEKAPLDQPDEPSKCR